jgi:hypothetical protein
VDGRFIQKPTLAGLALEAGSVRRGCPELEVLRP